MEQAYVAIGRHGLLKIGMSNNPERRRYSLLKEFRKRNDELVRMQAFEPMHSAHVVELMACFELGKQFSLQSGREWFSKGDFELACAITKKYADQYREAQRKENTPAALRRRAVELAESAARIQQRKEWAERASERRVEYERVLAERRRIREIQSAGPFPALAEFCLQPRKPTAMKAEPARVGG